ncbi:MAG: DNA recombination protein RmuC [Bdellovibrionales bacterium]|nr:DNA recombination protein RmuC [Bdellovibrionales bacterium]
MFNLIVFFCLAILAFILGNLFFKKKLKNYLELKLEKNQIDIRLKELLQEIQELKQKEVELEKKISVLETQLDEKDKKIEEREKYFKEQTEQFQMKFEHLSNKIFSENTKSYREETTKNLTQILKPFKEDIENFKKSIQSVENKGDFLDKTLQEFKDINKQMSQQTSNLEQALKGETHVQGQFGEFVLENILKKSNLRKGEEFDTQVELKDQDNSSYRADAVVNLPDNKFIIIDSKTSFKSYMDYLDAKKEEEKQMALKQLFKSIEKHIKNLSPKQYHFLISSKQKEFRSPDFTLMFIPNEGIFSLITQKTQNLFEMAWKQSIVLVSPTNLYATLRTVASIWKIEKQNKNAKKIADESGKMYDKFYNFIKDLKDIDKNIKQAQKNYDSAFYKLEGRGNLVSKMEKIKSLGANVKKDLKDYFTKEELESSTPFKIESSKKEDES